MVQIRLSCRSERRLLGHPRRQKGLRCVVGSQVLLALVGPRARGNSHGPGRRAGENVDERAWRNATSRAVVRADHRQRPALQRGGVGAEPRAHRHHVAVAVDRLEARRVEQLGVAHRIVDRERVEMLFHVLESERPVGDDDVHELARMIDCPPQGHVFPRHSSTSEASRLVEERLIGP